jgi:hypothetical protein
MKIITTALIVLFFSINGYSQTIINGDFENNLATGCDFNMHNLDFTFRMNNCYGFGTNSEMDIQTHGCGYANVPSNNFFVSLAKTNLGEWDGISLEMNNNLVAGTTYQITYMEFGSDTLGNNNLSLEWGHSTDSLSFGQSVFTSLPVLDVWTQRTFTFIASHNGRFITVRNDTAGFLKAWSFIDKVEISTNIGIEENFLRLQTNIFPNPANERFAITFPSDVNYIQISNAVGQIIKTEYVKGLTRSDIEIELSGIYFVNFVTDETMFVRKLVVQN